MVVIGLSSTRLSQVDRGLGLAVVRVSGSCRV